MRYHVPTTAASVCLTMLGLVTLTGCDAAIDRFPPNRVHALVVAQSRDVATEAVTEDVAHLATVWFGTPRQPRWPSELLQSDAAKRLVDPERILRASGGVYSDQRDRHFGLFNEHCVTCHGVSGGGDGPASGLQNPYPRDFRAGVFKWKSTRRAAKPTRGDLLATLRRGGPGSGMPSFASVSGEDREALVDYVIYLAVRGEFERRLQTIAVDELDYGGGRPEQAEAQLTSVSAGRPSTADEASVAAGAALDALRGIVDRWDEAAANKIDVPVETPSDEVSIRRGEELFHGPIANCVGCHGKGGAGQVSTLDFDDWTKEYTTRLGITPSDRDAVRPFRQVGAPRPRQIDPRELNLGVYRGGGDSETLYRRIVAGIAGTPMPGVLLSEQPSATGLTESQIWDLVHYVQWLGEPDS